MLTRSQSQSLDRWLTTPPEDPDWVEEAENLIKRLNPNESQSDANLVCILEGLLEIIYDEVLGHPKTTRQTDEDS